MAAAENEVAADSDRFLNTYYDRLHLPSKVLSHEKFLILGPKGAGKSAASYFVSLSAKRDLGESSVFDVHVDFDELNRTASPLASLDSRLVGDQASMTDAAWRLFLGVRYLDSLLADPKSAAHNDGRAHRLAKDLKAAGLASDDYPNVLRKVRERRAGFNLSNIFSGDASYKEQDSLSPGQLGEAVLKIVLQDTTPNKHILSIDGLDKAIGANPAYWQTLAALIRVSDSIRRDASRGHATHVIILVMCREDVFRRANFPDGPKIASDGGVRLEWHAEAADAREVYLWDYLAAKAQIDKADLFRMLPRSVPVASNALETVKYALQFTRYTPRDMSQLFKAVESEVGPGEALTGAKMRTACDSFASNDLLPEMRAESVGLLPAPVVEQFETIISTLGKRIFGPQDMNRAIRECGLESEISYADLGEYLFLQGAIGNYSQSSGYVQFYHRRNSNAFSRRGLWVLHTGLLYAMNLPWSGH